MVSGHEVRFLCFLCVPNLLGYQETRRSPGVIATHALRAGCAMWCSTVIERKRGRRR